MFITRAFCLGSVSSQFIGVRGGACSDLGVAADRTPRSRRWSRPAAGTFVIDLDAGGGAQPDGAHFIDAGRTDGAYEGTTLPPVVKSGMVQGSDPLVEGPVEARRCAGRAG